MLNKIVLFAVMVGALVLPNLAQAWSLTTRINSASGQLQVNTYPVQTGGSVIRSIPSGTATDIVITPSPGYVVSKVQQGATYLTVTPEGQTVSIPGTNTTSQTINVWFAAKLVSVTATAGTGGSVAPAGTRNYQQGAAASYVFTPAVGNSVLSISGVPAGATVIPAVPAPTNSPVTVSFAVPATPVTMNGVFLNVIANAGIPQTALVGSTVTLDGSGSVGATSYAWSQVTGPAGVTLSDPAAQKPTFLVSVAGSYQFMLTVNGASSAYTSVIVSASAVDAARIQCQNCHQPLGIGTTDDVFGKWSGSPHSSQNPPVMCYSCHVGANTGGHPGPALSTMGNICLDCHAAIVPVHPFPIGTNTCTTCHNPHSTAGMPLTSGAHFNNLTSAGYPASYVTSRSACTNCHYGNDVNATNRHAWAQSGHGLTTDSPWREYDFKTMADCVRCHTTSGFIAYSSGRVTAAWGNAADKSKEVLTCIGCHSDITTGAIRAVTPVRPYPDDSYTNPNVGMSNICVDCHSGRYNGNSVARLATFSNVTSQLVQPHYLAAGGILSGKAGYRMSGFSYAAFTSNTHQSIGIGNKAGTGASGPCVACHKNPVNGHTFGAGFQNGAIPLCANCHGTSLDGAKLDANKAAYATALAVLKAELAAKGYTMSAVYPYFSNRNWGSGQAGADTMGAAFNYVLLANEPGGYAHNPAYAKQLVLDAIDYLDDGISNGSVESTVQGLVGNGITQGQADSFIAYKNANICTDCHGSPPAYPNGSPKANSHGKHNFGCTTCHAASLADGSLHANGVIDVTPGTGVSFTYAYAPTGGTCSNISCHHNGTATWGVPLACDGCHGAPPATPSHMKHYGGSVAQASYGSTNIAQDYGPTSGAYIMNCGNCHPMDSSSHMNGTVEVELYNPSAPAGSLKALNPASAAYVNGTTLHTDSRGFAYTAGACSNVYCHSYNTWTTTQAIPVNDPAWQSKTVVTRVYRTIQWDSASLTCAGCHGNPTRTSYPSNDGGAGDSHAWIDGYGYENLHNYNMGYEPLSCTYCHHETVRQFNTYTRDGNDVSTVSNVPIYNFSRHVNGRNDVVFFSHTSVNYRDAYNGKNYFMSLGTATYDQGTKTCSNVACHLQETSVKWGTPYRWETDECDRCHGYAGP